MNYFKYQFQGSMGPIWALFSELEGAAEETSAMKDSWNRCDYGHTLDIIHSAMNGNILSENGEFSLKNYEYACQKQERVDRLSMQDKLISIVELEDTEDKRVGYKEVASNKLKYVEEAYSVLENNEMFERCLSELVELRSMYIVELGIDPMELLRNALRGIPSAVKELKNIKDSKLKEIVVSLCEYGTNGYLQSRLDACMG